MNGEIKLKPEKKDYRDEECVTQAAWMKKTKKKTIKVKVYK